MSFSVEIIRDSFEKAKPIGDQVVSKFYDFLFSDYPAAKDFFATTDMEKQKKALLNSLVFIVTNLESPKKLQTYLYRMGQRHVDYGVKEEHYALVGNTLLKTFAHFFKEAWTEDLESQWISAYNAIAGMMIEGANDLIPNAEKIREKANDIANKLVMEALHNELNDEIKQLVHTKVRQLLLTSLEEESKKLFKKVA